MSQSFRYNLGFTSAAFLYRDSVLLASLYVETGDWDKVREIVLGDNLLQIRTLSAQKRIYSETYTRLKPLSPAALEIIANSERDEKVLIIWYAICKKYALIRDFSVQILSPKLRVNDGYISEADFNVFFNNLATLHDELSHISILSKAKLTKNLFSMLKSAGIIQPDGMLRAISVPSIVREIVQADLEIPLEIYPGLEV